jgi:hypothetical protein
MVTYFVRLYKEVEIQYFQYSWNDTLSNSQQVENNDQEVSSFIPEMEELSPAVSNTDMYQQKADEHSTSPETIENSKREKHTASIILAEGETTPTAFQIVLKYDPVLLTVNNVANGNLWTETNILKNIVIQEQGKLEFAAGQGFGASITSGKIVLVIEYEGVENAQFSILPESQYAYVGNFQSVPLNTENTYIVID